VLPAPIGYWPAHRPAFHQNGRVMSVYEFVIARSFRILEQKDPGSLTKQEQRLLEALAPIIAGYRQRESSDA